MIVDTIYNAEKYSGLHPLFSRAFQFIKENDLQAIPEGVQEIEEGLKVIISNKVGKTKEESLKKFECHNKNIDIQVCVKGTETIAWKPRSKCTLPKDSYNADKDVLFYDDQPDTYFQIKDNQFAIFYPEDVHAPMIGNEMIKKIVFKIKI